MIRALANVRQYISPNGSTWTSALEAAREMYEEFDQGGRAVRGVPRRAVRAGRAGAPDRRGAGRPARGTAEPQALAEAESTVPLHARDRRRARPGVPRPKSRLPSKLAEARAAVRKSQVRRQSLAAMDRALADGSASQVYEARDDLVEQYADLVQDRELITRMTAANELIRKAVTVDSTRQAGRARPRPEPLGPPTSVVLRDRDPSRPAARPAAESIVFALAEGIGYGIDATTGAPLWQVPLGLASPFVPQAVARRGRGDRLRRPIRRAGPARCPDRCRWPGGCELGERVADPPLVLGNQLVQVVPSGKLLFDLAARPGELQATMNLGRPLARTPVSDESGRHLYVLGRQDILFVLNRDPLGCAAVEYLGQPDGSIPCTPALLGRYPDRPRERLADRQPMAGPGHRRGGIEGQAGPGGEGRRAGPGRRPTASGQFVWATGDRAGFEAFAVGEYGQQGAVPLGGQADARRARDSGPAFALARSERELWAASGPLRASSCSTPSTASIQPIALRGAGPGAGPDPGGGQGDRGHLPGPRARRHARSGGSTPSRARSSGRRSSARRGPRP